MRQPRFTYAGAFHHCTNRGINGEAIFSEDEHKMAFLDLLAEKIRRYRMQLFAFCVMDNHYHLVMQNSSGRMSDFFRNLNTHYAFYYRKTMGGKGYVFQSRFHSTIIQDDSYLKQAIVYVLQNPLRAGLSAAYHDYRWSSGRFYRENIQPNWLDVEFVLVLFGNRDGLDEAVQTELQKRLPLLSTPFGPVLGEKKFVGEALERFERRHQPDAVKKRRLDDFWFDPVEKVIGEFEHEKGVKVDQINTGHYEGKRLRAELLIRLRDGAGLTYREISEFQLFSDLVYRSMSQLYINAKKHSVEK